MTPERWEAVKDLFQAALEVTPAERAAFISEATKDDPALAAEVRALLSAHGNADMAFEALTRTGVAKTLAAGSRLGPYEIVSLIGAGGMGEVYKGRDTRLGRTVAIKVLPSDFAADQAMRKRLEREARTISSLNHPHICALFDIGEHETRSFLVMEYLEGESLADRLRQGPLPLEDALRYAREIAAALAEAHRRGIVHRDLKPANVMLTRSGAKLLDFGIAKLHQEHAAGPANSTAASLTGEGDLIGTPLYMSPEQFEGKAVDARTDVFAFGLVLYEMITGCKAFQAPSQAGLVAQVLKAEPPPVSRFQPLAPAGLEIVLRRCLAKDPAARWPTAADLASALAHLEDGRPARSRRRVLVAAVATALLLAAAAAMVVVQRRTPAPVPADAQAKSIAVLPFENLSADPDNAYFADGITEDVLTQLAKIGDLKVIARTSVMRYKGTDKRVREIAQELGVATILEGSVRREGNRIRIVGQLIEARTERHLWAETYDRELADIFAIQADVAQQIAAALKARLTPADEARIARRPTAVIEAYDLYVRGRERYYRYRKEDNDQAIELFRKALTIDPTFALAQAGLADALSQRSTRFAGSPADLEASGDAARRAVELDPRLPEAHKALALSAVARGHIREAVAENRRAVELSHGAGSVGVGNLGTTLDFLGRFDEALPWIRRSIEVDPTNAAILGPGLGRIYDELGESLPAEATLRKALELNPNLGQAYVHLITVYLRRGRRAEALELARNAMNRIPEDLHVVRMAAVAELLAGNEGRARTLFERVLPALQGVRLPSIPDAGVETYLASLDTRDGKRTEAKGLLSAAAEADLRLLAGGNDYWLVPFDLACVRAMEGDTDEALRWLERAYQAGWRGWPQASWSPLLAPLRSNERFQALMRRIDEDVADMRRRAGLGSRS
jgi:TolB-like protein/Tfp pilus assembly protein PilF/predicted Ser/Thr protein kinase